MDVINKIFEEKLSYNNQYFEFLNKYYFGNHDHSSTIELEASNKDDEKIFDLLQDIKDKVAYEVGCTINVSGVNPLYQMYFVCKTCDKIVNNEVKV